VTSEAGPNRRRPTQADRRARSRSALLQAAARALSREGYADLVLERVAREAGYTRGALYHQFANKEELTLAVVAWVQETWYAEMGPLIADDADPVHALLAIARGHAIYCRRDIARIMTALRVEFSGRDHTVGRAVEKAVYRVVADCTRLVAAAIESGAVTTDAPPQILALAIIGAVEGLVINLARQAPFDAELAERAVVGLLGLSGEPS
jgi:AcrR family transcriptional regulator